MSSFVCSPKHFNSAEDKMIKIINWDRDFYLPYSLRDILPKCYARNHYLDETKEQEIKAIFDVLRDLNVLCVNLQYKHHAENLDKDIDSGLAYVKTRTEIVQLSKHGLYNALTCIGYQIETEHLKELRELTIEEENALFFLKEMTIAIGQDIIRKLPEDKTNRWLID